MRSWRRLVFPAAMGATALVCASGFPLVADQSTEPTERDLVLGTWVLNVEESAYDPGPPPKSQTRLYEAHPEGVKATIMTVDAEGKTYKAQYVADYNSLEYPLSGSSRVDAIKLRRVSAYVAEATLKHAHKVIGTAERVIAKDGKSMTITYKGIVPDGRQVHNVAVYDKKNDR